MFFVVHQTTLCFLSKYSFSFLCQPVTFSSLMSNYYFQRQAPTFTLITDLTGLLNKEGFLFFIIILGFFQGLWFDPMLPIVLEITWLSKRLQHIYNFKIFGAFCMYISREYAWHYRAPMFLITLLRCSPVPILGPSSWQTF